MEAPLKFLKPHRINGQQYQAGDKFDSTDVMLARFLHQRGVLEPTATGTKQSEFDKAVTAAATAPQPTWNASEALAATEKE